MRSLETEKRHSVCGYGSSVTAISLSVVHTWREPVVNCGRRPDHIRSTAALAISRSECPLVCCDPL